ncbi:MAG: TadE/TadG family type IV pilus assembly protein [Micropepsaceae bacterium]
MRPFQNVLSFLGKFRRKTSGTTAIEFAIVALPFFSLMFAIFDVSLVYFATSALENAVAAASREIRTGQAQAAAMTQTQFRDLICARITPLLACDSHLVIDVRKFTSFGTIATPPALNPDGTFAGNSQFQIGTAGDVVVVRAFYAWPMLTPTGLTYSNMTGHSRLLSSATAFRNEPF